MGKLKTAATDKQGKEEGGFGLVCQKTSQCYYFNNSKFITINLMH